MSRRPVDSKSFLPRALIVLALSNWLWFAHAQNQYADAKKVNRPYVVGQTEGQAFDGEPIVYGNMADLMSGEVPTFPTIVVDYRDDDATRMREAGLLDGPLPMTVSDGGVASGPGCSFAVDCDDGNRCTSDSCNFTPGQPAGSGTCVHVAGDSNVGNAQCAGNFGLACGGCDDGLFCNGVETCSGGVCVNGTPPCVGNQVCSETFDLCQDLACSNAADCSNAGVVGAAFAAVASLRCNGAETCVSGVCVAGSNPCGSGGICGERKCSAGAAVNICLTDEDCAGGLGTCSLLGPICLPGRCCTGGAEPACSRRLKKGICSGGANAGAACLVNSDCASNNCPVGGTSGVNNACDTLGGIFYGGDAGTIPTGGGFTCPLQINGVDFKCPKYSSGIAPRGPFPQLLGPISDSPVVISPFGVALQKLGDDYTLSNPGVCVGGTRNGLGCGVNADCPSSNNCNLSGTSFIRLDYIRFVGGSPVSGRLGIEFYDDSGDFIEDLDFQGSAAFGIHPILLDPALLVPARGFVVFRNAPGFFPDARLVLASTDAVDVGSIDAGKMWINDGPVMSNFGTTGILALELEGAKAPGTFGACCNDVTGDCTNNVLPWDCTGAGNNFQGVSSTCPADCGTGACCAADGGCTVTTQGGCDGTFQGFGTDCDTSNGGWNASGAFGEAHCCPQPVVSGADNCEGVNLHVIAAPPEGEVKIVTITGNNSSATSTIANPDSCFPPSNDPSSDPGWWEGFVLVDDCTIIYVDHCCTDPVHRPAYRIIYDSCPCGAAMFPVANPYNFPEPSDSRGLPYCAEDDNAWQCFGLLGPGDYYYPIYSALAGHHGDYQLHIVAKACPTAACCLQDQCVDNVTQFECDAVGGFFLAPPHRTPAVNVCSGTNGQPGSTCYNGSCCTGPGECSDVQLGQPIHKSDCDSQAGNFVGGVRCQGGTCAASPNESCAINADCPGNDTCLGGQQALAQQSPCPICEIEGVSNCQAFDNTLNFTLSDRHIGSDGLLAADDVKPDGTSLTQVCVWGFYLDGNPDASVDDCGPVVTADHFRVRVYNNDPATGRSPGTLFGERFATSEKGIVPGSLIKTRLNTEVYGYQLVLSTPISGLTAGATYWIEVSNDVSESLSTCNWFWSQRAPNSSSLSFGGTDNGYQPTFETPAEQVFCTNFSFTASTTGAQVGSCCTCDGVCSLKTLNDCANANGVWDITRTTCAGVVCPSGPPANDNCANAPFITAGSYIVNNQCATTDGFGPIVSDFGSSQIDFDVWYKFVAPASCNLTVSECQTGLRFDSMLAVYYNPTNPTVCPPCPLTPPLSSAHLAGIGQDESCDGVADGGPGIWVASDQILRNAQAGECFLLRIGSFPGNRGTANLNLSCETQPNPAAPTAIPLDVPKNRFISMVPGNAGTTMAMRVRMPSLHHPNPPNIPGQSPIPYVGFESPTCTDPGCCVRWVGPPIQYVESFASGIPFYASQLLCAPHFRDWSTVGTLHVHGSEIIPSSVYEVQAIGEGYDITVESGYSAALTLSTARWGDIVEPFQVDSASSELNQPDVRDLSALFDKFFNMPGAVPKVRALMAGDLAGTITNLTNDFNFSHLASCISAIRGIRYPYSGPVNCPSAGSCPPGETCGNLAMEVPEQCDDGNRSAGDGCGPSCRNEVCGDGVVHVAEQCDDGNVASGDGCSSSCILEVICGNCRVDSGERCDDGNGSAGDGCDATCQWEGNAPTLSIYPILPLTVPASSYPLGTVITGRKIRVPAEPARLWFEVRISGWNPQLLRSFQAVIDPDGLKGINATPSNPGVDLTLASRSCTVNADCRNTMSGITGSCFDGEPSACVGGFCEPVFQNRCDPEWVFSGEFSLAFAAPSAHAFYGDINPADPPIADLGGEYYIGNLVVDVPAGATGTYDLIFTEESLLIGDGDCPIGRVLRPATVQVFFDCNGNDVSDTCDIDCGVAAGCDVPGCGQSADCDSTGWPGNGIPDECDIANCAGNPACDDCNLNGIPDGCDIGSGVLHDANHDNVPDECASYSGSCVPPSENWSCGGNWTLGGQYPDNIAGVPNVYVTLDASDQVFLDVNATIPSLRLLFGASLRVSQTGVGNLSIASPGNIEIGGDLRVARNRAISVPGGKVTVVPGGTYAKDPAIAAAASATLSTMGLTLKSCPPPCTDVGGSVELSDTMSATIDGDLIIDGRQVVNAICGQAMQGSVAGGYTPPVVRIRNQSTFDIAHNTVLSGSGQMVMSPDPPLTTPVTFGGDFLNESSRPDCFQCRTGGFRLDGTSQFFEVAGTDRGQIGSVDGAEFVIGALDVAAGTQVTFRNAFDNNALGQASCEEALYVEKLTLGAGSAITLNNCRVYYETLIQHPSATVTTLGCGQLLSVVSPAAPDAPGADPSGLSKGRVVSIAPPATVTASMAGPTAFRVTLSSLHHVSPPYTGGPSVPFTSFEGQVRWVGPPTQYVESTSSGTPFRASTLQCAPYYHDWSTVGLLHIFGSAIVPSSTYRVQTVAASCASIEGHCTAVSAPLIVNTTRWGDVEAPFNPPSATIQPDLGDVSALVNKFRGATGAPIKARALLAGDDAFGNINTINVDFGFGHISACVDAFRGRPYPYIIATCP